MSSGFLRALVVVLSVLVLSRSIHGICAFEPTAQRHGTTSSPRSFSASRRHRGLDSKICVSANSNSNSNSNEMNDEERAANLDQGLLVLATVPMAWGTFEPAVRLVYKYEPTMPPLVFSFAYYWVATTVLAMMGALQLDSSAAAAPIEENETELQDSPTTSSIAFDDPPLWNLPLSTRGGIELGTYLFLGNAFQVIGLKTVPSDRAAFLLQLTTIFVPLLKNATGATTIPLLTWIACLVALWGVAWIGLDDGGAVGALGTTTTTMTSFNILDAIASYSNSNSDNILDHIMPTFSVDDGYIILAAVFYTFHCVRLETYARSTTSAIGLATAKATTEMLWSGLAIVGCMVAATALGDDGSGIVDMARVSGETILSYGRGIQEQLSSGVLLASDGWPKVGLATLWVGAVTVAYTIYAQSFGQSRVTAVTANLIYSSQPIFTALVAYVLLGERLGANGYIGGLLIGAAVLLVIAAEAESETETERVESMATMIDK